ncbi:DUF3099 domain-containing protein [Leucobacter sp. gxy201]|uniref:DUF3099 domain-containing protein n=1 Tax=Leucobacter sp. gxy201 TaxID=2957200 RepID=UPI003D9FCA88
MSKSYSVTSAGVNPAQDRAHRMRMYYVAMVLRVLCVISLFWVRGWWVLLVGIAVAVLPWFAVMVGNAVAHGGEVEPDAPEPLQLQASTAPAPREDAAETLIVVDVEPARRGGPAAPPAEPDPSPDGDAVPGEADS